MLKSSFFTLEGYSHLIHKVMANFFSNKARAAAAATASNGASTSKAAAVKENQGLQPWVEK